MVHNFKHVIGNDAYSVVTSFLNKDDVQYINGEYDIDDVFMYSCAYGYMDLMTTVENNADLVKCMKIAGDCGQLNIIEYIYDKVYLRPHEYDSMMKKICINNHVECLKFFHGKGCKLTRRMSLLAIKYDSVECIKYINWYENIMHCG